MPPPRFDVWRAQVNRFAGDDRLRSSDFGSLVLVAPRCTWRLATIAPMRFRIWHLLAAMAFVALWAPLAQWLLELEAQDHPWKPQTTIDVIAFWLGSATFVGIPILVGWIVVHARRKNKHS